MGLGGGINTNKLNLGKNIINIKDEKQKCEAHSLNELFCTENVFDLS